MFFELMLSHFVVYCEIWHTLLLVLLAWTLSFACSFPELITQIPDHLLMTFS